MTNPQSAIRNQQSTGSAIRNPNSAIKVLLVDDSLLTLAVLKRMLANTPEIQVVGTATNGQEAAEYYSNLTT